MRRVTRVVSRVLSALLLGTVVLAGVALIGVPKATGSHPLTVLSGSMEPTYDPGDVVVVRPTDADDLQIGDVVTFQPESGNPDLTTHRVVAVVLTDQGRAYTTQGDANDAVDPAPVMPAQVRGTVWYSVPLVGHRLHLGLGREPAARHRPGCCRPGPLRRLPLRRRAPRATPS